jgi:hypothetical protein
MTQKPETLGTCNFLKSILQPKVFLDTGTIRNQDKFAC